MRQDKFKKQLRMQFIGQKTVQSDANISCKICHDKAKDDKLYLILSATNAYGKFTLSFHYSKND